MNLKKTLKRKFYLKYFTLVFLLLLYVPIIGLIVTQFAYKDYFMHFFITFIVMFAIAILLNIIYEKRFGLPQISNIRDLTNYLEYFSSSTISDLEYTESITWFSRIIHSAYLQKAETQDIFTEIINKLHLILRPCIFRKNCASVPEERSAIPLQTEQSSVG